ncbi:MULTISPECIES: hypothetical protein [unclassified Rhizobium]
MTQPVHSNQPIIPQHVTDQLESEWRQVRSVPQTPRPATQQQQR